MAINISCVICLICFKTFKNLKYLSNHIKKHHNIISKEYYDKFLNTKQYNNGKCICCGKQTDFLSLAKGYRTNCGSSICKSKSYKLLMKLKYGIENIFQRKDIIEKIQNKVKPQRKQIISKIRKTREAKNNGKWHKETFGDECQKTRRIHFGENANKIIGKSISKSKKNRTKEQIQLENLHLQQSMKQKYGYEFAMQVPEIKKRFKQYCLKKYGTTTTWVLSNGNKISKLNIRVFNILEQNNIQFQKEFNVCRKFFDIKIDKLLLEINGDYWHANPCRYKSTDVIKYRHGIILTAQEVWNYDLNKKQLAENNGYIVQYLWESEINLMSDKQILEKIKEYIKNANDVYNIFKNNKNR